MKTIFFSILVLVSLITNAQQTINLNDFKLLEGNWKGSLTYLDYRSGTSETIKSNAAIAIKGRDVIELSLYYTDEPDHNNAELYQIKEKGTMLNNMKVVERIKQADGALKIIFESKGPDENDYKPAIFNHIYVIAKNNFTINKMVRFEGEDNFFERKQYSFSR
jgi:hypothetical protein